MRHVHSPRELPDAATANRDNVKLERQLDADGQAAAVAMGTALRNLRIPIGNILTSPTFRALETVRALGLGDARSVDEGDGGTNMLPDAEGQRSAWLRTKAAEPVAPATNVLLVTHLPNLRGGFGDAAADMADVARFRVDQSLSLSAD